MNVLHVRSFILHPSSFILLQDFPVKISQLHRRRGGFKSLVTQLDSRAINRLVDRVCSYNSVNYRHARLQTCFTDSSCDLSGDVFEMRSLTADDCANANHGIKLLRLGEPQGQQREFKGAGNSEDFNQFLVGTQSLERVECALNQARANEVVPTTGDDRKTKPLTVEMTFVINWLQERFGSLSDRILRVAELFLSIGDAFLSGKRGEFV
jgi:hypothetical protein